MPIENTVTQVIKSVKEEVCNKICKYPCLYSTEEWEEHYETICNNCPMDRL